MEKKQYQVTVNDQYEFADQDLPLLDVLQVKDDHFHILHNHKAYRAEVVEALPLEKAFLIRINGNNYQVTLADQYDQLVKNLGLTTNIAHKVKEVKAPMPGLVLEIMVEAGQTVKEGEPLFILEAMKMENVLKSPGDGTIAEIVVEKGAPVDKGAILLVME